VKEQPGYDGLQKAIRKAGGLHDPIIVSHDGYVVEGNTRTAAVTTLHEGARADPKWHHVPVARLPKTVPARAMAMLMASYHVAGKTVWRPYAQADQVHELHKVHKWTIEQIADETRMSSKEIQYYLDAYSYLVNEVLPQVKNGAGADILEKKFSHALEFVKHKNTEQLRESPAARKVLAKLLIEGLNEFVHERPVVADERVQTHCITLGPGAYAEIDNSRLVPVAAGRSNRNLRDTPSPSDRETELRLGSVAAL
jgi:hypothetical protein